MGPEAIGTIVGAVVAGLAHRVVLLDVEAVVAFHWRLVVLAVAPTGVPAPVHEIGIFLVRLVVQPERLAAVRRYYVFCWKLFYRTLLYFRVEIALDERTFR